MVKNNIATYALLVLISLSFNQSAQAATSFKTAPDLKLGDTHAFVKEIQNILNTNGFVVNKEAGQPGSQGFETSKFGLLTQKALAEFQKKYAISPAMGNFGLKTKTKMSELATSGSLKTVSSGKPVGQTSTSCTSATKDGITWTWTPATTCGTYVTGDWWVVGPITITDITPRPTLYVNGTVINPPLGNTQGFTYFIDNSIVYDSNLNVGKSLPFNVAANKSVVSTITEPGYTKYNKIKMYGVLTVVTGAPADGSFRPYPFGNGSKDSAWKESDIDYSKLASLDRSGLSLAPSTAELSNLTERFSHPWLEHCSIYPCGIFSIAPYESDRGYGRDISVVTGTAALALNLNYSNSQKRNLLIGVVQNGLDNYGFLANGYSWYSDGGWNMGRLSPLLIAAGVLTGSDGSAGKPNLRAMIKGSAMKFQEFQSTFRVSQADVDRNMGVPCNDKESIYFGQIRGTNCDPIYRYTAADIGRAEWGNRHYLEPYWDNNWWPVSYRAIGGMALTAPTMTARVMNMGNNTTLRDIIAWEPIFEYAKYHIENEDIKGTYSNPTPPFHKQFYSAFSGGTLPVSGNPDLPFAIGNRVTTLSQVNVRDAGSLSGALLGTQAPGATGTIIDGPVSGGISWWKIDYDNSTVDGWTGDDKMKVIEVGAPSTPSTPSAPDTTTSLVSPTITYPTSSTIFSTSTNSTVTITWSGDATKFLTRFRDMSGSNVIQNNNQANKSETFNVTLNHTYKFWVHSGDTSNYSTPASEINFTVSEPVASNQSFTLTASKKGTGAGYIIGVDQAVTSLNQGSSIIVTAEAADTNSIFTGWEGDCSGTGSCVIDNIQANKVIRANFDSLSTPSFSIGDRVKTRVNVNVRSTPALGGSTNLLGVQTANSLGTILSTSTIADGIVWYNINYDTGVDGYSGQDNLVLYASSSPTIDDDSDGDGVLDTIDKCLGTPSNLSSNVNNYGCPKPIATNVKILNNTTTSDITNISNLEIEDKNSAYGKIKYTQPVNIFGSDSKTSSFNLDTNIQIQNRKVIVNSAAAPQFNKPAIITLYGINLSKPLIKKDGEVFATSTSAKIISYDRATGVLVFQVDGFSTYDIVEDVTTYTLNASKTGTGTGSIVGIDSAQTVYTEGTIVTLTASADAGSSFAGWGGDCLGTGACMVTMAGNRTVSANFSLNPVAVAAGSAGGSAGGGSAGGGSAGGGSNAPGAYVNPNNVGLGTTQTTTTATATGTRYIFNTDLTLYKRHPDVIKLQQFLNTRGYIIAKKGAGSPGFESTYFGPATRTALIKFQIANKIKPAQGYFGKITRTLVNSK